MRPTWPLCMDTVLALHRPLPGHACAVAHLALLATEHVDMPRALPAAAFAPMLMVAHGMSWHHAPPCAQPGAPGGLMLAAASVSSAPMRGHFFSFSCGSLTTTLLRAPLQPTRSLLAASS